MTAYDTISLEVAEDIATLRLNRPDKMNALNAQMRAEITDVFRTAHRSARVIVMTGNGPAFCSGQDLSDSGSAANLDIERVLRDEYEPMIQAISDCPVPTISAVNGPAAGAGANLALAADVVIATQSAYFLQAFTRIGLIPDAGGTYWMPRQMGAAKAMGAALFAEPVSAQEASDWGMIWEAVKDSEFESHWKQRANHLAKGPTEAYARVKTAIRGSWENKLQAQLHLEASLQGECSKTRDFQEGVLAFLEKRAANYEGR